MRHWDDPSCGLSQVHTLPPLPFEPPSTLRYLFEFWFLMLNAPLPAGCKTQLNDLYPRSSHCSTVAPFWVWPFFTQRYLPEFTFLMLYTPGDFSSKSHCEEVSWGLSHCHTSAPSS